MSLIQMLTVVALLCSGASAFNLGKLEISQLECIDTSPKVDCGYDGIHENQCEERDCCWAESNTNAPWCFYKDGVCPHYEKKDCGYNGIDQKECEGKGCCWKESDKKGEPWCFYGVLPVKEECSDVNPKVDCGEVGTQRNECEERDCCWVESNTKAPWCFYNDGMCPLYGKKDCGYPGIDQKECEGNGCCWKESKKKGEPWCFYGVRPVKEECSDVNPKVDCGELGTQQYECEARDCCWVESNTKAPWCFYNDGVCPLYGKKDCGYKGINQKKCERKGCCWEESDEKGEPWCFYGVLPVEPECVDVNPKVDCGEVGTQRNECEDMGCCWVESETGAPWCFREGACPSRDKKDCGYVGINQEQCEGKGCCWEESEDEPWCFFAIDLLKEEPGA